MSNNVIPNFLPPPYDFTKEEEEETEEEEEEEEEYDTEEKYNTGSLVFCGFVLGLAAIILTNSKVNVSFKFSLNKKTNRKIT